MIFYEQPSAIYCPLCDYIMEFKSIEKDHCKIACVNRLCENMDIQYKLIFKKANVVKYND